MASEMTFHTRYPLIKSLTAIVLVGVFVFALVHALDHVEHEAHCIVCNWVYGFCGLVSAILVSRVLYTRSFFSLTERISLYFRYFTSPSGRSPPAIS